MEGERQKDRISGQRKMERKKVDRGEKTGESGWRKMERKTGR
jgi:hypothetical protein